MISAQPRRVALPGVALAALILGAGSLPAQAQFFWPDDDIYHEPQRRIERPRPRIRHPMPKLADAPKDAPKPQGPVVVAISIEKQNLKVYDGNGLFAETPVSTGMRGHATPMGVFSVIQKNKWHRSNIYSGAPMPYMQRITWSGVALHAGALPGYPASHGCIRLPAPFAARLWSWTRLGARVIVTPGEVSPADFSHARLIARKPALPKEEPRKEAAAAPLMPPESLELRLTSLTVHDDGARVRTADASGATPSPPVAADAAPDAAKDAPPPLEGSAGFIGPVKPRSGHVAAFVSRKDGKLYVRQNFEPLFEAPVTIAAPERPLGTHVFTARADADDANTLRWSVVSLPTPVRVARHDANARRGRTAPVTTDAAPPLPPSTAAEALDRLTIPDDAMARIAMALAPGGSLVVSDHGLGDETGRGTDFIVPLR